MESTYWALEPTDEIGDKLVEKIGQYFKFLQQSGRLDLYQKMYRTYYGPALRGSQVEFTGEQGELVAIQINDLRNLLTHLLTLITSQRPAFDVRSANTDHKSQAQTILGKSLLDYYLREKEVEDYLEQAAELALVFGDGFVSTTWNSSLGEVMSTHPETGAPVRNGDIEFKAFGPLEYVRDFTQDDSKKNTWGIPIDFVNKFDLAAKFPEFEKTITGLDDNFEYYEGVDTFREQRRQLFGAFDSDEIPIFRFYHQPTDALPEGRQVTFLADGTVLLDETIPYESLPIKRIEAARWLGTIFGYTVGFDLLPVEEMTDSLHSTICTNNNAFGVQNIWSPKGNGLEVSTLAGGLRLLEAKVKPEPLQLTATATETYKYLEGLSKVKETLSGVNSVSRGNPERDMSGAAMALLQSTAIQFSNAFQKSFVRLLEDVGTDILDRLRIFATTPRVAAIAGKTGQKHMKEFQGDDISTVNRVLVDSGNPIMNTTAGKLNLADVLLQSGLVKDPHQYIMVATTGNLEPLYEGQQSELMLIRAENEMLSEGQRPQTLVTDNPLLHIKEHSAIANSPEARANPQIMQNYTAHIQEHIDLWRTMDPDLAALLGLPPPPNPAMLAGMTPGPQGPAPNPDGQPGTPLGQEPGGNGQAAPQGPAGEALSAKDPNQVQGVDLPNMPAGTDPNVEQLAEGAGITG